MDGYPLFRVREFPMHLAWILILDLFSNGQEGNGGVRFESDIPHVDLICYLCDVSLIELWVHHYATTDSMSPWQHPFLGVDATRLQRDHDETLRYSHILSGIPDGFEDLRWIFTTCRAASFPVRCQTLDTLNPSILHDWSSLTGKEKEKTIIISLFWAGIPKWSF